MLLLSLPALAIPAPDEVVSKLYKTHKQTQDMQKTIRQVPKCLTPGFLGIMERALKGQPPKPFVDVDVFCNNQMGLGDFEIVRSEVQGYNAEVRIKVWDSRSLRKGKPQVARVILTDVKDGDGYQIKDIEWDGTPTFKVRDFLTKIATGQ